MPENPILKDLNKEQKEAVLTVNGPLLIIAGAGSGKTKALTHRVSYLMESGVRPNNIVALTFTNRAAEEMRERIYKLLNLKIPKSKNLERNHLPFMGTFHSLGSRILRKKINLLGRDNNFLIYDEKDRLSLIKELMASINSKKRIDLSARIFSKGRWVF
jgi:DNA helicase-2/ATP-dependent DNA helicase PcrA